MVRVLLYTEVSSFQVIGFYCVVCRSRTSIGSRKSLSSKRPSTGLEQKPKTETYQQNINSLLKTSPRISGLDKNLLASIKRMEANEGLGSIGGLGPNLRKFAKSCDVPYGVEDIGSGKFILYPARVYVSCQEVVIIMIVKFLWISKK